MGGRVRGREPVLSTEFTLSRTCIIFSNLRFFKPQVYKQFITRENVYASNYSLILFYETSITYFVVIQIIFNGYGNCSAIFCSLHYMSSVYLCSYYLFYFKCRESSRNLKARMLALCGQNGRALI